MFSWRDWIPDTDLRTKWQLGSYFQHMCATPGDMYRKQRNGV
jgi:hypothetical protein